MGLLMMLPVLALVCLVKTELIVLTILFVALGARQATNTYLMVLFIACGYFPNLIGMVLAWGVAKVILR